MRVTDKLPFNFRNLGLIARLLPRARVIHCRRDPRDVAVFVLFHQVPPTHLFRPEPVRLRRLLAPIPEIDASLGRVLPLPMLEVDYEALVDDPEREIRRIIDFAGLTFDDRCVRFYEDPHRSCGRRASIRFGTRSTGDRLDAGGGTPGI